MALRTRYTPSPNQTSHDYTVCIHTIKRNYKIILAVARAICYSVKNPNIYSKHFVVAMEWQIHSRRWLSIHFLYPACSNYVEYTVEYHLIEHWRTAFLFLFSLDMKDGIQNSYYKTNGASRSA